MSSYWQEYKNKLVCADEAVKSVKSGDWISYGSINAHPVSLDKALAKRKDELRDVKIWTLLSLRMPEVVKADPRGESFCCQSWHFSSLDRKIASQKTPIYYAPMRYLEVPRYIREEVDPIQVAMLGVCPMDKNGFFNFGPQNSHHKAICERAEQLIVEVNTNMPRCLGGYHEAIHISEVDYIVEGKNEAMITAVPPALGEVDQKVARQIVAEIEDGSCIQLGIGSMANAVGLMICESDLKDLGCHTEMFCDAFVDLFEAGKLNGRRKSNNPEKMVYSFALGSQRLYEFIDDNPSCASFPVDYTNQVAVASANERLISINNAIEVDIYGQICSESCGTQHISGTGGQIDFVLAAYESRGGKSFICLPSTYQEPDGKLASCIVPTLKTGAIVTDSRSTGHYIVTEYGIFNIKGKTTWQKAEGIISLAHPDFRDDLIRAAQEQKIWSRYNKQF
ncbi:MAG: butyryl-CoA:acetate CoA-transferase [Syntrophomonadaceae bacterium]|nr:butyryl-CoA:acetate CoA-transferase [Syntrophomonadaceae bacterium]